MSEKTPSNSTLRSRINPVWPAIILTAGAGYLASMLIGVQGGLLWQLMPRRHLEA